MIYNYIMHIAHPPLNILEVGYHALVICMVYISYCVITKLYSKNLLHVGKNQKTLVIADKKPHFHFIIKQKP